MSAPSWRWYQTTKWGVPGEGGLVRLNFTRGTPSRQALRSAKPIQMFRLGHCPTLDTLLRVFKLLVQNSDDVWLGLMRLKGGVGVRWGLVRLKFTRGTPSRQALRSAKPIQMCRLVDCSTLDTLPGVFKLLVQNSDDVRLGLTRLKSGVGVRWGFEGREFGSLTSVFHGAI